MTVVAPADHAQTATALRATWDLPGPVYYRLGKDDRSTVPGLDGRFALGGAECLRDGARRRARRDWAASRPRPPRRPTRSPRAASTPAVVVVASVQPAPGRRPRRRARGASRSRVTVEAHYVDRRARLARRRGRSPSSGLACRLVRCGVRTTPDRRVGQRSAACTTRTASPQAALAASVLRRSAAWRDGRAAGLDRPARPQPGRPHRGDRARVPERARRSATPRTRSCSCRTPAATARADDLPRGWRGDARAPSASCRARWAAGAAPCASGSRAARGDLLCYTNSARTAPEDLALAAALRAHASRTSW